MFLGFAWPIVLLSHSHIEVKYVYNLVCVLGPYLVSIIVFLEAILVFWGLLNDPLISSPIT